MLAGRAFCSERVKVMHAFKSFLIISIVTVLSYSTSFSASVIAAEGKVYHLTGVIEQITADTIILRKEDELFNFQRQGMPSSLAGELEDVKVGDRITVRFTLAAKEIIEVPPTEKTDKDRKQEAGRAAPSKEHDPKRDASPDQPNQSSEEFGEKLKKTDDRAFYRAAASLHFLN